MAVGSKLWTQATWSSFAACSTHGSGNTCHRYKESVFVADLNCFVSLCVGSRLYMVFAGVTFWSVTNLLTIFKVRILECVTGWNPKHFAASRCHCHHVFLATSWTRSVKVATAIFTDRCSCLKVRRLRLRRRFCRPVVHQFKRTSCSLISWHSTSPSSLKYLFGTRRDRLCSLPQQHRSVFLWPSPRPQVLPRARKGRVGEVLR